MKNLLKMMAVFGVVNTPTYMLMANHTNGVVETQLEQRSLNSDSENILIDAYDIVYQDTNVGAYLDTLTNEIGLNSIAIHNNAVAFGGLNDRVTIIEDEMLNVDRYDLICYNQFDIDKENPFFAIGKHHYKTDGQVSYVSIMYLEEWAEYSNKYFGTLNEVLTERNCEY